MTAKGTVKDERDYVEELLREEPIKSEVIVELREHNKHLLNNQVVLLTTLVQMTDSLIGALTSLNIYRRDLMASGQRLSKDQGSCAVGCQRHEWTSEDGWTRKGDAK